MADLPISMRKYRESLKAALDDSFLRRTLDKFAVQFKANRAAIFADVSAKDLIADVANSKDASLSRLDELYELFRIEAEKKGVSVHRAGSAKECNELLVKIAKENGVRKVIKSKSMTAEEIHASQALEEEGMEVVETDLGEWIIQLRSEPPSHMVMPAIHLSREQVAETFSDETGERQESDIEKLVKVARRELRRHFATADMGLSGANFAIAKSGSIGICTNEGNARLVTTLPKVHVAIAGLDKLVPDVADALKIISVLPRNATAQAISSYVTLVTGAVSRSDESSPKKIFHVIFLDNGRANLLKDPKCSSVLRCVRCGACANVCPVYRLVGGHRMGYVYIGAIGLILTYFFHGRDRAKNLIENCINCGACKDVCAAGIDLPQIIQEIRARISEEDGAPIASSLLGAVMGNRKLFHALLKYAKFAQSPLRKGPYIRHLPSIFAGGQDFRSLPAIAGKSFREMWPRLDQGPQGALKVAIFAGCAHDFIYPEDLAQATRIMRLKRAKLLFPMGQTCCGLPLQTMGQRAAAVKAAKANIDAFFEIDCDRIVTLCASCAANIKERYVDLASGDPSRQAKAEKLVSKITDFSSLVKNDLGLDERDFANFGEKAAYHSPCHLCRGLGVTKEPRDLIAMAGEYVETPEEDVCCGFGGSYSVKFPELSGALLNRKLDGIESSGAQVLVTDCPGCVLQLRGGEEKRGGKVRIEHIAEFLTRNLKNP